MLKQIFFSLLLSLFFISCEKTDKIYRIGIDPSYYPIQCGGKKRQLYAFSKELLDTIAQEEGVIFEIVTKGWDNLTTGLKNDCYDGILSAITPKKSLDDTYAFSYPFLNMGAVLVVKQQAKVANKGDLQGKIISIASLSQEALLVKTYPGVTIDYYYSIPEALEKIISHQIDGIVVNYLQVNGYLHNLYLGQLKIEILPFDQQGLRLVTLHGEKTQLMEMFNRGMNTIKITELMTNFSKMGIALKMQSTRFYPYFTILVSPFCTTNQKLL